MNTVIIEVPKFKDVILKIKTIDEAIQKLIFHLISRQGAKTPRIFEQQPLRLGVFAREIQKIIFNHLCVRLQVVFDSVRAEILSVRPADSTEIDADTLKIGHIL